MTEKRFILVKCYNEQWGIVDKSLEEIDQLVLIATSKSGTLYLVNELNALHEENEQLKQFNQKLNDELQETMGYLALKSGVEKENEQLKKELHKLKLVNEMLSIDFSNSEHELWRENEQLKQELAIYRKVASCSNCKYHNYDWYDDGDEFEVCDKGNDVTDGICEEWEEL